jgi:hypothetical protein
MRSWLPCFSAVLLVLSTGCQNDSSDDVSSTTPNKTDSKPTSTTDGNGETPTDFQGEPDSGSSAEETKSSDTDPASMPSDSVGGTETDEVSPSGMDTNVEQSSEHDAGRSEVTAPGEPPEAGTSEPMLAPEAGTTAPWPPPVVTDPDEAAQSEVRFDSLEQCAVDSACPIVTVDETGYDVGALRCVLEQLAHMGTGTFQHRETRGNTIRDTVILVNPGRVAEMIMREQSTNPDEPAFSSRMLCSVAPPSSLQQCLDQLPDDGGTLAGESDCANPATWFTACGAADIPDVACSR